MDRRLAHDDEYPGGTADRGSLGRGLKLALASLMMISTVACTTTGPTGGRPQKTPGEVAQEEVLREAERVMRETTRVMVRTPSRRMTRSINCQLSGRC